MLHNVWKPYEQVIKWVFVLIPLVATVTACYVSQYGRFIRHQVHAQAVTVIHMEKKV